jgi:hypothetical protein
MSKTIHLYVQNAVRTEKVPYFKLPVDIHVHGQILLTKPRMQGIIGETRVRLLHSALGMSTEIIELRYAIERGDRVNVLEGLGDVLWYWAIGLDALNLRDFDDPDAEPLFLGSLESERRLVAYICLWADLIRRHAIHAKDLNPNSALTALRDIWRGVGEVCHAFGISRDAVMDRNIAKLRARFPAQYDGVRFEVRDLVVERQVLAGVPSED